MKRVSFALIALGWMGIAGCGGSATGNWGGTEAGIENGAAYGGTVVVALTESSGTLTGTFTSTPPTITNGTQVTTRGGNITGTVSGTTVTVTLSFTSGCTGGSVVGTGTKTADAILLTNLTGTPTGCTLGTTTGVTRTTNMTLVKTQ
jgi:hypothetical protein